MMAAARRFLNRWRAANWVSAGALPDRGRLSCHDPHRGAAWRPGAIEPKFLLACDLTVADTETTANGLPDPVDAQSAVGDPPWGNPSRNAFNINRMKAKS